MKNLILFRKLARNKKGLDDDLTDIIIAVIFTAMIFIFVFMFFTSTNRIMENSAMEKSQNLEKNYILLNYLRAPLEDEKVTIAEFLGSKSKIELVKGTYGIVGIGAFCGVKDLSGKVPGPDKDGILVKETRKTFENVKNWRVNMYVNEREFCSISEGKGKNPSEGDITGETVRALIPSMDPDVESIEIYFKLNIFGFSSLSSI